MLGTDRQTDRQTDRLTDRPTLIEKSSGETDFTDSNVFNDEKYFANELKLKSDQIYQAVKDTGKVDKKKMYEKEKDANERFKVDDKTVIYITKEMAKYRSSSPIII